MSEEAMTIKQELKPLPTFSEVTDWVKLIEQGARLHYNDIRARQLIDACAAHAMNDYGPIDSGEATRAAHEIAVRTAALLLARIYTEDAEIATLKAERDHFRKLAEDVLRSTPPKVIISHA